MDGDAGLVNSTALSGYVQRVAKLFDERDDLNGDIRGVYAEAKDAGFDTTTLREIVREYRTEAEARHSRYALLDQYRHALGLGPLEGTPLGEAAVEREAMERPKPFAEQPIKRGRGRPKKNNGTDPIADAMQRATVADYRPEL